jgi:hypothetical protein
MGEAMVFFKVETKTSFQFVIRARVKDTIPSDEYGYELRGKYVVLDVFFQTLVTMPDDHGIWIESGKSEPVCVIKSYLEDFQVVMLDSKQYSEIFEDSSYFTKPIKENEMAKQKIKEEKIVKEEILIKEQVKEKPLLHRYTREQLEAEIARRDKQVEEIALTPIPIEKMNWGPLVEYVSEKIEHLRAGIGISSNFEDQVYSLAMNTMFPEDFWKHFNAKRNEPSY